MIPLVRTFIGDEEIEAVVKVMRSGQLAAGPEVVAFEEAFALACGVEFAVAVNSGTAAIHAALEAVGVEPGDEVITTPFTFAATATPILMQRATPRFVDIDPRTFNADLSALLAQVNSRTKAVIAVDLFGLPVDNGAVSELRERKIAVIEDACQAIGARRDGVAAGALCDVGCFSLYATKNLMAGEGGVLTTDNPEIAARSRRFRQHGQGERYEYLSLGYNYRMTDMAAAIARVQLSRLKSINFRRRANAAIYNEHLAGIPGLIPPFVPVGVEHAYHQYSVLVDPHKTPTGIDRDGIRSKLAESGIGTGVYYPTPLHLNPLFSKLGYVAGDLPNAEKAASQIMALPIHPGLTEEEIVTVCAALRGAVGA